MAQAISPVIADGTRHPNEVLYDLGEHLLPLPILVLPGGPEAPEGPGGSRLGIGISRWKFSPSELAAVIKSGGEFYIVYCGGMVPPLRVYGVQPELDEKEHTIHFNVVDDTAALVGADLMGDAGADSERERNRGRDAEAGTDGGDR